MKSNKWIVECIDEIQYKIINKDGEYSQIKGVEPLTFNSYYEARLFADEMNIILDINEHRDKLQNSLHEYGCDINSYVEDVKKLNSYTTLGGYTEILKQLKIIYSLVSHGDDFNAKLTINKVIAITIKMAEGELDFTSTKSSSKK
jgi:hypothetical protein